MFTLTTMITAHLMWWSLWFSVIQTASYFVPCTVRCSEVCWHLFCVCSGLVAKSVDTSWARLVADAGTAGLAGVDCNVLYRGCHGHLDAEPKW